MKKPLINAAVTGLFSYFVAVFIKWDINPENWGEDGRAIYAYTALIVGLLVFTFTGLVTKRQSRS